MRGISVVLLTAGAGFLAFGQAAVASGDPAKPAQTTTLALPNDTGKRICRVVTPTGSRFTQRVCKTEDQWRHDEEQSQNRLDENRRGNGDLDHQNPPQ